MSVPQSVPRIVLPSAATLTLPGSKSEANRLLVIAALSGQPVTVTGASPSDDVRHLVRGLATLGFAAEFVDEPAGVVRVGPRRADAAGTGELFCGNAGTALRFLISVAAITPGDWIVTGDEHMQRRPIQPLVDAWRSLGVEIEASGGCPPVRVRGGHVDGGHVSVDPSISSQYLSSLMLVGARLREGLAITFAGPLASRGYAELTESLLRRAGVRVTLHGDHARIDAGYGDVPETLAVGGDWSGMGAWTCLDELTGSQIRADNLVRGSGQSDEQLHAALVGLRGDGERTVDVEPIPDQFLNLAVFAALRRGTTHFVGAANVRRKECDRVAVMARELRRCGVDLDEHEDGLTVRGGGPTRRATIDPEADHRVAMALALLGMVRGGVTIDDPGCVAKSYPSFWRDLERVRREHRPVAVVGMRAAGKSTFGRALAKRLDSTFADTDELFVAAHGPIAPFVEQHGWPRFREVEQRLVEDALSPGRVVATGGGAIEAEATRRLLHQRALVVHVDAPLELLRARLQGSHRPSLTGAAITDELDEVLRRRQPLYAAAANVTIDATWPTARQVDALLDACRDARFELPPG